MGGVVGSNAVTGRATADGVPDGGVVAGGVVAGGVVAGGVVDGGVVDGGEVELPGGGLVDELDVAGLVVGHGGR